MAKTKTKGKEARDVKDTSTLKGGDAERFREVKHGEIRNISIDDIEPNDWNP